MRQRKHITELLHKKIIRQTVGILCMAALLSPSAVSNAETNLIQYKQNGLIFASEENDGETYHRKIISLHGIADTSNRHYVQWNLAVFERKDGEGEKFTKNRQERLCRRTL